MGRQTETWETIEKVTERVVARLGQSLGRRCGGTSGAPGGSTLRTLVPHASPVWSCEDSTDGREMECGG